MNKNTKTRNTCYCFAQILLFLKNAVDKNEDPKFQRNVINPQKGDGRSQMDNAIGGFGIICVGQRTIIWEIGKPYATNVSICNKYSDVY